MLERAVPQFYHLKAAVRKMTIAGRSLWARASSCAKNKEPKAELVSHWKTFIETLPRVALLGKFKHLHALQEAPRLEFARPPPASKGK